jgi:putative hydrolase of the HAD superfamily
MARHELRAVFFDIDDTLYSTTGFAALARRNALEAMRKYGLRMAIPSLQRELGEVISEFSSNYENHFDKLLLRIAPRAYEGVNRAILISAAVAAYHDSKFTQLRPFPDVIPALKVLARTDLIRGIITSGLEIKQAEKLIRLGVYGHMTPTAIFISDQIGISKPNMKLFQRACSEVGVKPEESMYVGDHPAHDIDPANALGMVSVLVCRGGRHQSDSSRTRPRFKVRSFGQLLAILRRRFRLPV